jgi:hypothetical protein
MFWNDLKEIKGTLGNLVDRIAQLEKAVIELSHNPKTEAFDQKMEDLKECVSAFFYSEEEYSPINRIHDRLDVLVEDTDRKKEVAIALQTLDKFEDYMKNIDKLNALVNEFKGCVSLARGALEERRKLNESMVECPIKEEMLSKIDYIYYNMGKFVAFLQKSAKKSRKKK